MRLTQKNEFFEYVLPCQNIVGDNQATEIGFGETEYTCKKYIIGEAINKLGELEDVLEEFELTSAEDLRNYLNFKGNMAIWEGKLELKNKIAELEQELAELKQQLHDSPKKIVEEIRKEIEFPLYVHPDFDEFECVFDIDKLLDTILKKYGEKDE